MLRAFGSPNLYVQGPGALQELPAIVRRHGERVFVVIDPVVAKLIGSLLKRHLSEIHDQCCLAEFGGECTAEEIARLSDQCKAYEPDVIMGVGGGKAIDTAKGVRIEVDRPLIIIPTIASNDSPTSRICVVYTSDHVLSEVRRMTTNPDVVLVDTQVLVQAPARFFVAGVGDAISKKFEAEQCRGAGGLNFYGHNPPYIAQCLADQCFDIILAHAEAALEAVANKQVSEAFERTIEATILLSGLAFENGGLSIPHSLTRGLSSIPSLAGSLHGEQVAFGLIVQLILEERPEEYLATIYDFYQRIGLPRTLGELGYRGDPEAIVDKIAHETIRQAPYIRNFSKDVTQSGLESALRQASGTASGVGTPNNEDRRD